MNNIRLKKNKKSNFQKSIPLLIMFIPAIAYYAIFRFGPMFGLVMAFQNYRLADGVIGSEWVGMRNFSYIFNTPSMLKIIGNTLKIGILSFVVGFPFPVMLALFLNEVRHISYKKFVQTLVYLPHFLSWVAVGGIVFTVFSQENGVINDIIQKFGGEVYPFLYKEGSWITIFLGSRVWKETGFSAIIYLAALGGIDPQLYEAASLDGCGRWKQMFYITIPCLVPTVVVNLILSAGNIINVGFDQVFNLQTPAVSGISSVISTWVYQTGIQKMMFSISTAMGLFNSLLSFILVFTVNGIAKKYKQNLW